MLNLKFVALIFAVIGPQALGDIAFQQKCQQGTISIGAEIQLRLGGFSGLLATLQRDCYKEGFTAYLKIAKEIDDREVIRAALENHYRKCEREVFPAQVLGVQLTLLLKGVNSGLEGATYEVSQKKSYDFKKLTSSTSVLSVLKLDVLTDLLKPVLEIVHKLLEVVKGILDGLLGSLGVKIRLSDLVNDLLKTVKGLLTTVLTTVEGLLHKVLGINLNTITVTQWKPGQAEKCCSLLDQRITAVVNLIISLKSRYEKCLNEKYALLTTARSHIQFINICY